MEFAELGDIRQSIETVIQKSRDTGVHHFVPEESVWKTFIQ